MKNLYLVLIILFSTSCLRAQSREPNPSASPLPSIKEKDQREREAKRKQIKDNKNKPLKSAVNVSQRFRDSLPSEKLSPLRIPRFETPPVIDGKLDDEVWNQAAVFKDFYQISPGDNLAPSKPTLAYMGYDAENLYLAFHCFDEPDKIRATVAKRDDVFGEDNVQIYLDTYDDQRRAYVFGFNPLGIQQDGIYTEGQGADFTVDVVMESKGIIVADGWTLEARIPFKSFRYTIGRGKNWGILITRVISRLNSEADSWMPRDPNISSRLSQEGKITGIENIKIERTLEIIPSITISETGNRKRTIPPNIINRLPPGAVEDPGRFVNDPVKPDLSLNLKFNITPNVTLDAAINPDFAEIEADAPVVLANQRFPIYFEEKRPFFLEGSEIFQSPLQVFYSRQIIAPGMATKLTGKIGKISFGFLAASDKAPGKYSEEERNDPDNYPSIQEFLDKKAYFGVVRLKRDFGKENNIGFFGTARVFPRQRNFLGGFDGSFKFDSATTMQFQIVGTYSRRDFYNPVTDSSPYATGNGLGYYWSLRRRKKNRGIFFELTGLSRFYSADAGFTRRTNTNSATFINRFSSEPKPKAKLIRVDWQQFAKFNFDWRERSQNGAIGTNFLFTMRGNLQINSEFGFEYERLFEEEFGATRTATRPGAFFGAPERSAQQPYASIYFEKTVSKKLSLSGFLAETRNSFDYDFGNGIGNGFETRFPRVSPAYFAYLNSPEYLEYSRLRTINASDPTNYPPDAPPLDPGKGTQTDLQAGFAYKPVDQLSITLDFTKSWLRRYDTGKKAFDDNIFTLHSAYQFSRFTFIRARLDYDTLRLNMSGQLLFGWNPNPGTAFYVGYNDNLNYNGFNRFTGQFEPNFERNNRTFFIRASYLFRKSL